MGETEDGTSPTGGHLPSWDKALQLTANTFNPQPPQADCH
jgi:hypothetical protein